MQSRRINISRRCTGNNTIRTAWEPLTRKTFKTISAGRLGLKGSRRGSPYAAELVGREIGRWLNRNLRETRAVDSKSPNSDLTKISKETQAISAVKRHANLGKSHSTRSVVNIYLAGKLRAIGSGIRGLRATLPSTFYIGKRRDVTPKPHNGCRARKPRRV